MTRTGPGVDDVLFRRLRGFFDDDAIVELTALIALQNASSKFNAALEDQGDDGTLGTLRHSA